MTKAKAAIAIAALLLSAPMVSAPAFAEDAAPSLNPWVDCGIGAMIFPTTPVGAVISNVIWDYGLTATTSAMSSRSTCEGSRAKVAMFINTNYPALMAETAAGQGQFLAAVGQLMDCDQAGRATLASRVREEMPALISRDDFATLADTYKAEAYFKVVDKVVQTELRDSCAAV